MVAECITHSICRFDVMQNVYRHQEEPEKKDDEEEEDGYYASPEQRRVSVMKISELVVYARVVMQMESLLRGKAEGTVQLSPLVVVGPGDISLNKPIKITLPHCVPSSNQSWILKVRTIEHTHTHISCLPLGAGQSTEQ